MLHSHCIYIGNSSESVKEGRMDGNDHACAGDDEHLSLLAVSVAFAMSFSARAGAGEVLKYEKEKKRELQIMVRPSIFALPALV